MSAVVTRRRSSRRPSSRLAAAVGAVGLALALAACGSSEPDTVEEAVAEAAGEVPEDPSAAPTPAAPASADEAGPSELRSAKSLGVGDCLAHLPTPAELDADAIPVADCAGVHGADIYALADLSELGEEYPGFYEVYAALSDECGNAYLDHFGGPVDETGIVFDGLAPDEESWAAGETETICMAFSVASEYYSGELEAEEK